MRRRLAPACLVLLAVLAPAAHAGTLTMDGTTAVYSADAGETNELDAQIDDYGTVQLSDRNPVRTSGVAGCSGAGTSIDCGLQASALRIDLGDGDDTASVTGSDGMALTVAGGDGDDTLTVQGTPVRVAGDAGDDLLDVTGANAKFAGGPGDDLVRNHSKASVDCAGGGTDRAFNPLQLTRLGCLPPPPMKLSIPKRQTISSFVTFGFLFSAGCSRPCAIRWALTADKATRRFMHTGTKALVASGEPVDEVGYPDLSGPGAHKVRAVIPSPATRRALKKATRLGMTLELTGNDGISPLRPVRKKLILR